MEPAQAWTVGVGVLGLLTTVGVAVFTQVYQGRREDRQRRQERAERRAERWLADRRGIYARFLAQAREFRDEIDRHHSAPGDEWMEGYRKDLIALGIELLEELGLVAPRDIYAVARAHLDALATVSVRKGWLALGSRNPNDEEPDPVAEEVRARHHADFQKYSQEADETRRQLREMMGADLGVDLETTAK